LQINFRGSGGYGLSYQRYISANWDGVLTDLFDGMDYLHSNGEIDQFNSCIYGGSYGGYAATQAAIMRPDLFKCSVSDVGVYDLVNLFKTGDIQGSRGGKPQLIKRLGDNQDRLKEMSPHYNAEKLKVPFFMIHGKNDVRAPYEDAIKFSKKLNQIGFDHKTLFIEKEGHGYSNEKVRYESNMELINFFKQHLN
jgi:dipeptidyl aminopeptidase/acylaminoacyl peptidase